MKIEDIFEWREEDKENRAYAIRGNATGDANCRYKESIYLYDYAISGDDKSVLFPQAILHKIEDLNDFAKIKEMVVEYDSTKELPMWLYPTRKTKFNLKGHYTSMAMVVIPNIRSIVSEIDKEAGNTNCEEYLKDKIAQFSKDTQQIMTMDDINDNNMDFFEDYYSLICGFLEDLRTYIKKEYGYIDKR